jgi:hypothetical protein
MSGLRPSLAYARESRAYYTLIIMFFWRSQLPYDRSAQATPGAGSRVRNEHGSTGVANQRLPGAEGRLPGVEGPPEAILRSISDAVTFLVRRSGAWSGAVRRAGRTCLSNGR